MKLLHAKFLGISLVLLWPACLAAQTTETMTIRHEYEAKSSKAGEESAKSGLKAAGYRAGEMLQRAGEKLGPATERAVERADDAIHKTGEKMVEEGRRARHETGPKLREAGRKIAGSADAIGSGTANVVRKIGTKLEEHGTSLDRPTTTT